MAENEDGAQEVMDVTYKEFVTQLTEPFVDEAFPPDQRSIITSESVFKLQKEELDAFQELEYARISEVNKGTRINLFDRIDPYSIKQG